MRKLVLCVAALSAIPLVVSAQQLSESIEVRVQNIDVVVTDRQGHPVHGLTREDFELYENRKPQTITNFYEFRGDAAAVAPVAQPVPSAASATAPAALSAPPVAAQLVEARSHTFVVFLDNTSIDPFRRNQAIDTIEATLDKLVGPNDDAIIISWALHPEIVQRFTSDHALLKAGLEKARAFTITAGNRTWERNEVMRYTDAMIEAVREGRMRPNEAYAFSVSKARAYAEFVRTTERSMLSSMAQAITYLSGVDAKRVLIYIGGELEEHPGVDVFQLVDSRFLGMIPTTMPAIIRESDLNTTEELQRVVRGANANAVTLYMIDVADRGRDATEGSMQNPPDADTLFIREVNTYLSMGKLAWDTGGTVLSGTRNFQLALNNVVRDLGSYYSLGYKPPGQLPAERAITVKVKRPGLQVRTRRGYAAKTGDEVMQDRVVANALHSTLKSDFPVTIEAGPPDPFQNGLFRVKVTVKFGGDLTYVPQGDDIAGAYEAWFVSASADGTLSPIGKQGRPLKFPATAAATVKQTPFTHTTALIVKPGQQTISVVVLDRMGARVGYARAVVNAQ